MSLLLPNIEKLYIWLTITACFIMSSFLQASAQILNIGFLCQGTEFMVGKSFWKWSLGR